MDLRSLSDRAEIENLLTQYARAVDTRNWDLYRAIFTSDALIDYTSSGGPAGGLDNAVAFLATALDHFEMTQHLISNVDTRLDGDTAEVTAVFNNPMRLPGKAVWFTGGRQWRLVDAYADTATLLAIKTVLDRGGVIGGTSAGATIQGSYLVRGDTRSRDIVMGDHQEGFGFISNCAVDQHLMKRNRQFDLFSVIREHPSLLGIGIDEATAIVVSSSCCEIIGNSYVAIYNSAVNTAARVSKNDESLQGEEFSALDQSEFRPFHLLQEGDRFDLVERTLFGKDN